VGDATYGGRRERRFAGSDAVRAERQMLHAWRLGFRHPRTDAWMEFTAPVPTDFRTVAGPDLADVILGQAIE
jgi:23S rRNA pseudouridine1911/1915/1917 synthase